MRKGLGQKRKQCRKKGVKGALGTTFICFTMASSTRGAVQVLATYNTEPLEDVLRRLQCSGEFPT